MRANEWTVSGAAASTIITKRDGTQHLVLVDTGDLPAVSAHRWHIKDNGYVVSWCRRQGSRSVVTVWMHRLLLNASPGVECDHISGNRKDNRRQNLRLLSMEANRQNQFQRGREHLRGAYWRGDRGYWQAAVKVSGRKRSLGCFGSAEDAALAASAYRQRVMPFSNEARAADASSRP